MGLFNKKNNNVYKDASITKASCIEINKIRIC